MDTPFSIIMDPGIESPTPDPSPNETPQTQTSPTASAKKQRGIVPGSAADYRRREANRLAANRSRSRAHEKALALETAAQTLGEENFRLKQEIARLENGNGTRLPSTGPVATDTTPVAAETTATAGSGPETMEGTANEEIHGTGNEAQDSHSRTILAALMSGAVDGTFSATGDADADEASWMQGVEDMFKEAAESSGRLGELAAVAAGQGDDGSAPADSSTVSHEAGHDPAAQSAEVEEEVDAGMGEVAEPVHSIEQVDIASRDRGQSKGVVFSASAAAAATASAMAVAINAEMEKLLRDDLATTKAAIAKIEREIIQLRQQGVHQPDTEANGEVSTPSSILPEGILATDERVLDDKSTLAQNNITKLENELPVLREMVTRMRDDKVEAEGKLAEVVSQLQVMGIDGGEAERAKITTILKAVGGFVGNLLNSRGGVRSGLFADDPYCSPAFARRRRGRPPKSQSLNYLEAGVSVKAPDDTPYPKKRGRPRKSRLDCDAQTDTPEVVQATHEDEQTSSQQQQEDEASTAEQFILSHLQNGSTFADFLPQAHAEGHHSPLHQDLVHESPQLGQDGAGLGEGIETDDRTVPETPSVLSRLKRGAAGSCDICGRTETSVWRKLVLGGEDHKVCNACGLYHTKFGVIRPPELWGDGRSLKKRRAGQRQSTGMVDSEQPGGDGDGSGPGKKRRRKGKEDVDVEVMLEDALAQGQGDEKGVDGGMEGEVQEVDAVRALAQLVDM